VTNIDALSALIDRLIVEEIKYFFFSKEERIEEMEQQVVIIKEIRCKLSELFLQCVSEGEYEYLSERRTFNEEAIVETISQLVEANLNIGHGDRVRLSEVTKENPNINRILVNEKLTRKSNELRARCKNKIDDLFRKLIKAAGFL
tara:strand:- start:518 stop:952 length:435 start_codon:yes stop_codon:yes gene_type:complete